MLLPRILLISAVAAVLSACAGPRVFVRVPPAEPVRKELQTVKSYTWKIEFAEGTPQRARTFLEELTKHIMSACEIPAGNEGEIAVQIRTKAYWGQYQRLGRQASGAEVAGTVRFQKAGQVQAYQRDFRGRIVEPYVIRKPYPTEDDAPYAEAALLFDSYAEVLLGMIYEIYGPGPLLKALNPGKPLNAADASAKVLGDFAPEEAFAALRKDALTSTGPAKLRAVWGLGRFRQERAGAVVLEVLQKSSDAEVVATAADALGELRYRPAAPALLNIFRNSESKSNQFSAGLALTRITGIQRQWDDDAATLRQYETWVRQNFPNAQ